jgi:GT2 family glycosyltransferase
VIVPIYNGVQHLAAFFESLAAALPHNAEVIVIDDASTEPVLAAVPEIPKAEAVICLRNETNLGNAGAVNEALSIATGDILIQLNSDLVLDEACISAMITTIEENRDDVGIVGAKLVYPTTGRCQSVGMAFGLHSKRHVFRHMPAGHPLCCQTRDVQIVTGATAAMTRRVLELLGPLDHELFNHNLDLDHCLRAVEHGLRNIMCADAVAYHWRNRSGVIRYARVEAAEAAFWSKWSKRYRVDLADFLRQAIDHIISVDPRLQSIPFVIIDLSRGANQAIVVRCLAEYWEDIAARMHSFRQMSNDSDRLWLPLLLPNWLSHAPTPFIYLVDSHLELEENEMWFARRRNIVTDELIIDLSASALMTSDLFPQRPMRHGGEPVAGCVSVEDVVDTAGP